MSSGSPPMAVTHDMLAPSPPQTFLKRNEWWIKTIVIAFLVVALIALVYGLVCATSYTIKKNGKHKHDTVNFHCQQQVVVSLDGSGNFTSISNAIHWAPEMSKGRICIWIKIGVYGEKLVIGENKPNVALLGVGADKTVIMSTGLENGTVVVLGRRFMAIDISFENLDGQRALSSYSDEAIFYRCVFKGSVSTLYAAMNLHFFRDCTICGTDAFIFGNAGAIFQNCIIYVGQKQGVEETVITSQEREFPWDTCGFIFHRCVIEGLPGNKPSFSNTFLGSPGGEYSRVIVMETFIPSFINPKGWISHNGSSHENVYYGEFNNTGPGANVLERVRWPGFAVLSNSDATKFTVHQFFTKFDWLATSGIPYWLDL